MTSDNDLEALTERARTTVDHYGPALAPWSSPLWRGLPADRPPMTAARIGQLRYSHPAPSTQTIDLPAILEVAPIAQHLFVERASGTVDRATSLLNSVVLRLSLLQSNPDDLRILLVNPTANKALHAPLRGIKNTTVMSPSQIDSWLSNKEDLTCFVVIYDVVMEEDAEDESQSFTDASLESLNRQLLSNHDHKHQFFISFEPTTNGDPISVLRKRLLERAVLVRMEQGPLAIQNRLPSAILDPLQCVFTPDACPGSADVALLVRNMGIGRD